MPARHQPGLIVDLFAGGGGASTGLEAALGRPVDIAINHDPVALAVHKRNHPRTLHLEADIWEAAPRDVTGGRAVDVLWASPDCTHFSIAKGDVPRQQNIRSLAWVVVSWARDVKPRVVFLENVSEFRGWGPLGPDGRPDKARMGLTFKRWKRQLELLGYQVDYRVLDASLYGAQTRRRRLFLVARSDGQPIRWPEPTHGPGRLPLHTAAECIDWNIPCPSIFERQRPLAAKTLSRIAQGIRRFVLDSPQPFIVGAGGPARSGEPRPTDRPMGAVLPLNARALVGPHLVKAHHGKQEARGEDRLAGASLDRHGHLVAAFLAKHFGEREGGFCGGQQLEAPTGTVTVKDHHALATATLLPFDHDHHGDEPIASATAQGKHAAEARAFLTAYYGSDGPSGQSLHDPARTITAKHRLGLVTVQGSAYQITDIGMRMLEPRELLRAQFGRFAHAYDLSAARTKSGMVRIIGNSVPPEPAEAVVRANLPTAVEAVA